MARSTAGGAVIFQSISNPVKRCHGFSLVELMTTLALVAILMVIATNQVMGAKNAAYLAVMRADLHALVRAQVEFLDEI